MQIYQFYPNNNKKQATTPKKNKHIVRQIIMSHLQMHFRVALNFLNVCKGKVAV